MLFLNSSCGQYSGYPEVLSRLLCICLRVFINCTNAFYAWTRYGSFIYTIGLWLCVHLFVAVSVLLGERKYLICFIYLMFSDRNCFSLIEYFIQTFFCWLLLWKQLGLHLNIIIEWTWAPNQGSQNSKTINCKASLSFHLGGTGSHRVQSHPAPVGTGAWTASTET